MGECAFPVAQCIAGRTEVLGLKAELKRERAAREKAEAERDEAKRRLDRLLELACSGREGFLAALEAALLERGGG